MYGNNVTIVGNLTRDPELRHTPKGTPLVNLGVAWNRKYQQGGEEVEDVSFFNITCWGTLAENVSNSNLVKGSRVVVVGRMSQRSYETRDGENRSVVEIVAEEVSPSLKWATAEVNKTTGGGSYGGGAGGGGYAGSQERSPAPAEHAQAAPNQTPANQTPVNQTPADTTQEEPF